MVHEPESEYTENVAEWLEDTFGEENVEANRYLEATGRYADYWVDLGAVSIAVEVENDWEAAIKGVGQASLYAAHAENVWPLVVLPTGHVDEPESTYLSTSTPVAVIEI